MAEIQRNAPSTYYRVVDGKLFVKAKDGEPVEETYVDAKDREYRGRFPAALEGYLVGIRIASSEFEGKRTEKAQWQFLLKDGDESYTLTMHYESDYAQRAINALANVKDFGTKLRFSPWMINDKGKSYRGVSIYAPPYTKEARVMPKYDKESIPKWREVVVSGKTMWDKSDALAFYERIVTEEILPRLSAARSDVAFASIPSVFPADAERVTDAPDGLPF